MGQKKANRFFSFVLCVAMLLTLTLTNAAAGEKTKTAPEKIDPMVRVLLTRLNITDRMDIVLTGSYGLKLPNGTELYFDRGNTLSFRLHEGNLYLYYENMTAELGTECFLKRYKPEEEQDVGFSLTHYAAFYKADLRLKVEEDLILPIATLHVEDYLQCVVPYEMSEYFPLEALKAQTVAARTYVLRRRDPSRDYDVVDTTNDQVFKGYMPGFVKCERAIRETEGVCGFYNGQLAQCYYSASNGGRTELVESVWTVKEDYGYYVCAEDPYDLENPASTVRQMVLPKTYTNKGKDIAPYGLRLVLAHALEDELKKLGLDPSAESVEVVRIHSLALENGENGLPDTIRMEVSIMGRTRQEVEPKPQVVITLLDENMLEMETDPVITPFITPQPTPEPTPEAIFGEFVTVEQTFQVEISIFPEAESAFGMDISNNYENEIWSVTEEKDQFTLEARRYGHGVGMSQRGAEWMASAYGMKYTEILNFYYPGMELLTYEYISDDLPEAAAPLRATMGPAISPTPRPTLMPLSIEPGKGQWIAVVSGIDDDSSLNLRSLPNLGGDILMRLYKHQRLLVLERCPEEGWVRVRTDYAEGYVMESFLSRE